MTRALRISQVGVRGVVGPGLTATHVVEFVAAFVAFLREPGVVVVARDPRASGLMIREVTVAALLASGRDVVDLGIAPTPVLQHTITRLRAAGGISIGASHNAPEWNALKFFGGRGRYLSTAEANELLDFYHLGRSCYVGHEALGTLTSDAGAIDAYLDQLAAAFDFDALRRLTVVVDCCNGTSALVLGRLGQRHGFRPVLINERLEGVAFAHEPSTTARTVALQLAPVVVPLGAAAGFLFDADSDRVAIADNRGRALSEELVLPLVADYSLPREQGRTVITNLSTTALVDDVVRAHGGRVMRVPVGRQAAADALASLPPETVALAGEGTGAVMMPRFNFAYDGIASMLAVLSLIVEGGRTLADMVDAYPRYVMLKGEVPLAASRMPAVLARLRERFVTGRGGGVATIVDGLRVDWPDRWFHVRVSQTEPIVRVISEQRGEAPEALHASLLEEVRRG
ncbi:MAG: algC 2 [Acidobacteria bacterium]|nr:algC 2 [Acidobacteriota bacterium]